MVRLHSLDSLRSIAILIVIVGHTVLGYGAPAHLAPLQLGGIGVDLFFVLSGWLIGSQLFKEMAQGSIQIRRFWYRRWFRTLPAYYAVLIFTITQQYLTKENVTFHWEYFFLIQNYFYPLDIFHVSWSLAVEEQFYLIIAPLVASMVYLSRYQRLIILLILLALPSIFRELELYHHYNETHVRIDGCVMGVILALLKYQFKALWDCFLRVSGYLFAISVLMFFAFFIQRWYPVDFIGEPGFLTRAIMFGCWVVFANKSVRVSSVLYFPGAQYIATRSYAMYLLHPDAIAITKRMLPSVDFYIFILIVFLFTIVISEVLYRVIEKPFMILRDNIVK